MLQRPLRSPNRGSRSFAGSEREEDKTRDETDREATDSETLQYGVERDIGPRTGSITDYESGYENDSYSISRDEADRSSSGSQPWTWMGSNAKSKSKTRQNRGGCHDSTTVGDDCNDDPYKGEFYDQARLMLGILCSDKLLLYI